MNTFDPVSMFIICATPILCLIIGYWLGCMSGTSSVRHLSDSRLACARAELKGFTCGIVAAYVAYQRANALADKSPPVSVTGQHINPGQPTYSPPVAGAGGETG